MALRPVVLFLALTLALPPGAAHAGAAEAEAKATFKDGQKAYDLAEFGEALKLYGEAYRLKPLPALLFNIAQCHRQLSNWERAAFFYQRFLDLSPANGANLEVAKGLLIEMKGKQAAAEAEAGKAREREAAEREAEARRAKELNAFPAPAAESPTAPPVAVLAPAVLPPTQAPAGGLAEEPTEGVASAPLYRRWWFWTAAVAVVGAGVGVAVATQPRPTPTTLAEINGRK